METKINLENGSLGIETVGGIFTPIIEKGTSVPTSVSQIFTTGVDSQTSVDINLLYGNSEKAEDNIPIGRVILTGIPSAPKGVPQIQVEFEIDADGMLNVSAKDLGTGKIQQISIQSHHIGEAAYSAQNTINDRKKIIGYAEKLKIKTPDIDPIEPLKGVSEAVRSISDKHLQSEVLIEIALEHARAGKIKKALEIVKGVRDKRWRSQGLNEIAVEVFRTGELEKALEIAESISDKHLRSEALREITGEAAYSAQNAIDELKKVIGDAEKLKIKVPDIGPIKEAYDQGNYEKVHQEVKKLMPAIFSIKEASSALSPFKSQVCVSERAENLYKEAESALNAKKFKKAIELSEKVTVDLKTTSKMKKSLDKAQKAIASIKSKGYYSVGVEDIFSDAERAFADGNYSEVGEEISKLMEEAQKIEDLAPKAQNEIRELKKLCRAAKNSRVEVLDITPIEQAYNQGEYEKVFQEVEGPKPTFSSILDASSALTSFRSQGFVSGSAEKLYRDAESAFNAKNFQRAIKLSEKVVTELKITENRALKVKESLDNAKKTIESLKSMGYYTATIEDIYSKSEKAFEQGHYSKADEKISKASKEAQKIEEFAPKAKDAIDELKKLISDGEKLKLKLPDISLAEEFSDQGNYERALQEAVKLKQDISSKIEDARPELKIEPELTHFKLKTGIKTKIQLINEGNTPAESIKLEILPGDLIDDNSLATRILSQCDKIHPGETGAINAWLKFSEEGDLPINFLLKCQDALGRSYEEKHEVWVTVSTSVPRKEIMTPAQFTPRPTHTSSFPLELEKFYEGFEYIGKGGFGRVFRVRNKEGEQAAVKVPLAMDESLGKAFLREIQVWQRLNHINIVKLNDMNIYPVPYIEMEYCNGGTLDDIKKPISKDEAAKMVLDISAGLKHAHSLGRIHRDLKPMNILLSDGVPKITDWGLSKVLSESKHSSRYGFSPLYAAPEQISPKKFSRPDERTDVYQLGVIFYELVTGRLPFDGDDLVEISTAITMGGLEKPSEIDPDFKGLDRIITKAMARLKEDRYQDMGRFQEAVAEYLKLELSRSLKTSISQFDVGNSADYCGELCLVHAKLGDVKEALKYAYDLKRYAPDELDEDVENMVEYLEYLLENDVGIDEEFFKKIDIIAHRVKTGKFTKAKARMEKERKRKEEKERKRREEEVRRKREQEKRERQRKEEQERLRKEKEEEERRLEEERQKREEERKRKLAEGREWLRREEGEQKKAREAPKEFTCPTVIDFVLIPAGEFDMGSPENDEFESAWAKPAHHVKISKPFYLGKYPVTQKQWKEIMGNNPSYFKGLDCPVEEVSLDNVQEFIKKLNKKEGTDKYRLPTEAEWEYAARAGTKTRYSFGNDESRLGEYAWYDDNSDSKTHPVGQKKPNPWGLYDMHGNVWEWVQDWYGDYPSGTVTDPTGPSSGSYRVFRGGSWYSGAGNCRSADRYGDSSDRRYFNLGFRLAFTI